MISQFELVNQLKGMTLICWEALDEHFHPNMCTQGLEVEALEKALQETFVWLDIFALPQVNFSL